MVVPQNFAYKEFTREDNVWVMADPHLYHDKMIEWGLREEGFTEKILQNWREQVGEDDYVVILGDFTFNWKDTLSIVHELPGRKFLIKGNHDHIRSQKLLRMFDFVFDALYVRYRFSKIRTYNILMFHYPLTREQVRSLGLPIDVLLHGHVHLNGSFVDRSVPSVNLSAEYLDYRFIELSELIAMLRREKII